MNPKKEPGNAGTATTKTYATNQTTCCFFPHLYKAGKHCIVANRENSEFLDKASIIDSSRFETLSVLSK